MDSIIENEDSFYTSVPYGYVPGVTAVRPPDKLYMADPSAERGQRIYNKGKGNDRKHDSKSNKDSTTRQEPIHAAEDAKARVQIPPKTKNYKFQFLGQKFRFLDPHLEHPTGGVTIDRHASKNQAIAVIESKDAEYRVVQRHKRHVDLLVAELSKMDQILGNSSLLPSQVLHVVTARKRAKEDMHEKRRKNWRKKQQQYEMRGAGARSSGNTSRSNANGNDNANVGGGLGLGLSQVLEAPSLLESGSVVVGRPAGGDGAGGNNNPQQQEQQQAGGNNNPQQQQQQQQAADRGGDGVVKPSMLQGLGHDSFYDDVWLGGEGGGEGEGDTEPELLLRGGNDNPQYQQQQQQQQQRGRQHAHMRFSTKRHWYEGGPVAFINPEAALPQGQSSTGGGNARGTVVSPVHAAARRSVRERRAGSKAWTGVGARSTVRGGEEVPAARIPVRNTHISTASERHHSALRRSRDQHRIRFDHDGDGEDGSSEYVTSSEEEEEDDDDDDEEEGRVVSISAALLAGGDDDDDDGDDGDDDDGGSDGKNKEGSSSRPESEDSVNNARSRAAAAQLLSAVPQLDTEALQDLRVGLRNVHMYYRNYGGDLEAYQARGVEEVISSSPRDWGWSEAWGGDGTNHSGSGSRSPSRASSSRSPSRPGTTTKQGSRQGSRQGTSNSRGAAAASMQDDSNVMKRTQSPPCTTQQKQQSKSAPVTARPDDDDNEDGNGGDSRYPPGGSVGGYNYPPGGAGDNEDGNGGDSVIVQEAPSPPPSRTGSAQRDIAAVLAHLRRNNNHGPVLANTNVFSNNAARARSDDSAQYTVGDNNKKSKGNGDGEGADDSNNDYSWMVRAPEDRARHGHDDDNEDDDTGGSTANGPVHPPSQRPSQRRPGSSGRFTKTQENKSSSRKSKSKSSKANGGNYNPQYPHPGSNYNPQTQQYKHAPPEHPVKRVRTPLLLKAVLQEEREEEKKGRCGKANGGNYNPQYPHPGSNYNPQKNGRCGGSVSTAAAAAAAGKVHINIGSRAGGNNIATTTTNSNKQKQEHAHASFLSRVVDATATNPRSKRFVSKAREVHAELRDLPIYEQFRQFSERQETGTGARIPLMGQQQQQQQQR